MVGAHLAAIKPHWFTVTPNRVDRQEALRVEFYGMIRRDYALEE